MVLHAVVLLTTPECTAPEVAVSTPTPVLLVAMAPDPVSEAALADAARRARDIARDDPRPPERDDERSSEEDADDETPPTPDDGDVDWVRFVHVDVPEGQVAPVDAEWIGAADAADALQAARRRERELGDGPPVASRAPQDESAGAVEAQRVVTRAVGQTSDAREVGGAGALAAPTVADAVDDGAGAPASGGARAAAGGPIGSPGTPAAAAGATQVPEAPEGALPPGAAARAGTGTGGDGGADGDGTTRGRADARLDGAADEGTSAGAGDGDTTGDAAAATPHTTAGDAGATADATGEATAGTGRDDVGSSDHLDQLIQAFGWGDRDGRSLDEALAREGSRPVEASFAGSSQLVLPDDVPEGTVAGAPAADTPLGRYVAQVEALIRAAWDDLELDVHRRALGIQGATTVQFLVTRRGEVEDLRVVRHSGHADLDRLALRAVPTTVPPIPADVGARRILHRVTLHYRNPIFVERPADGADSPP